ncbi:MAG TPA: GrpB family protein [Devosiaceae bacterium]
MEQPIHIAPYSPAWVGEFRHAAERLRARLENTAIRIDHIGSTAIVGVPAKPVIDIQVSVVSFQSMDSLQIQMEKAGFVWRRDNPELTKRYFREQSGSPRTHVHVRQHGSWHEQWALLFRDYMRMHPEEHSPYAELKHRLAAHFGSDRQGYTDAKDDHFWSVIRRADRWAARIGWQPDQSDA